MRKLLISLTLGTCALFAGSAFAGLENCDQPTDGDWSGYCTCFLDQGVKAIDSCSAVTCRPKTAEGVKYNILNRLPTDSDITRACGQQEASNVDNSCLAPGVDATGCFNNIKAFKEHCDT